MPFVAKDDRKQFQYLNIALFDKPGVSMTTVITTAEKKGYFKRLSYDWLIYLVLTGSLYVCGKPPTYPSPKSTFYP